MRKLEPADMIMMNEVESLAAFQHDANAFRVWDLAKEPHSYTIETQKGEVVACAGVVEHFDGYGTSWVMMDELARKYMTQVVHIIRKFLWLSHFRRIDAAVDCRFENGQRLARLLGFRKDCILEGYSRAADFVLYSIVKKNTPWA